MTQQNQSEPPPSPQHPEEWTYNHFLALLLLYASHADYEYSQEERDHILTLIPDSVLGQVEQVFQSLGEFAQLDLILQLKDRFIQSEADRTKLFVHLGNQFRSDGEYTRLESGLYQFLDRLI